LCAQGKLGEAVAVYRNLGGALAKQGRLDEAITAYHEAIRLRPEDGIAHGGLGTTLFGQGMMDEALKEVTEATRLQPGFYLWWDWAGYLLVEQGRPREAIVPLREAVRIKADYAQGYRNLSRAFLAIEDWDRAREALEKILQLEPNDAVSQSRLQEAERGARFAAILRGAAQPEDVTESVAYARMAYRRARYFTAVRLWADALDAEPKLAADRQAQHAYNAACAAALAAAGRGKDEPPLDDAAKRELRQQAQGWLRAELAAWRKFVDERPDDRPAAHRTLQQWQKDTDLASVREGGSLGMLPEAERREWEALWAEVLALLN
jgi:tetratricopeptide (TPR) repeat protein